MNILNDKKHIFFVGIGGIGMSGIAEILLEKGFKVSGSDRQLSDITTYLAAKGALIYEGHLAQNLKDADLLVYSSAVPESNPERQEATRSGITQIRRAEMLAQIMIDKMSIAIGGTHGKTTTTALCSKIIIDSGLDPTVVVGGKLKNLNTNARLGKGDIFITEADEYDRSFLALSPDLAVLTTLEADHLDCYKDLTDIKSTFVEFANKVSEDGFVVCCIDSPGIREILPDIKRPIITYGTDTSADYRAVNLSFKENGSSFDIQTNDLEVYGIALQIPGQHNILNALAAFTIADLIEVSLDNVKLSLQQFTGVDRRFEVKSVVNNIMIVDDYAHHPSEIAATISAARSGWDRNLIIVFQPHLYSRTRDFYKEFAQALSTADQVILADIYAAREDPIPNVDGNLILREAKNNGYQHFLFIPEKQKIEQHLVDHIQPGDMVITMGAGDIWTVSENLVGRLQKQYS
jgi:UDP-N-acetylmuramate--alanine ligase